MWEEVLLFLVAFRSQIFDAFKIDVFLDLFICAYFNAISTYFNAISVDFYAVKCLIYIYFV